MTEALEDHKIDRVNGGDYTTLSMIFMIDFSCGIVC